MPATLHLYLLGFPVRVGEPTWDYRYEEPVSSWKKISEEMVQYSFAKIPQDGFIVFRTYEEAHLYAHAFVTAEEDPNLHNGIYGSGNSQTPCLLPELRYKRRSYYKPVVFEVIYTS